MYLILLKWGLYSKIKRTFLNLKLLRYFNKKILIYLFIVFQIGKILATIIGFNLILNGNYISIGNMYLDTLLKDLWNNNVGIFIYFFYLILYIHKNSIKAVKLKEGSKIKKWLLANTHIKKDKLNLTLILEYIIFNGLEIITFQVPLIVLILLKHNYKTFTIIIITCLYIIEIILITLLMSLIYNIYLTRIKHLKSFAYIIFIKSIKRVFFFLIFYYIGISMSNWMNKFPLIQRQVKLLDFQNWINEFKFKVYSIISNYFNNEIILSINTDYFLVIILLTIFLIYFCIAINKNFHKRYNTKINHKSMVINNKKENSNLFYYYMKTIIRSNYIIRNVNSLLGSIYYWSVIGFYAGVLKYITPYSKVYYLLIIAYVFYPSYFLIDNIFQNLTGKCCIDGEGINIYFWVDKKIYTLFKYKRCFFLLNIFGIAIVTNFIIGIINGISMSDLFLALMMQIVFSYTLYNLLSLPSIIFPHFEHSNIEEINGYKDREQLNDKLNFSIIVVGIPFLVLPTILYLTDYINKLLIYRVFQFILIWILLMILNLITDTFIKKKVNSIEFIYSVFER